MSGLLVFFPHNTVMIARLRGTFHRLDHGEANVDVRGVGYAVSVPTDAESALEEGKECDLWIATYVREDRLELYGFTEKGSRRLFELLIAQSGIGPKMALELCAVPRDLLVQAVERSDAGILTSVKGVGKKKAEKLILELKGTMERHPEIFRSAGADGTSDGPTHDQDALDALVALGYETSVVLQALRKLPPDLGSTEERVTEVLRSL